MRHVVIIGAGVGGLAAAIRLAKSGCRVTVVEARDQPGGLAASVNFDGFRFDAGPYILLDRLGLEWAIRQLGIDGDQLKLRQVECVYESDIDGEVVRISSSLDETADELERRWPGSGQRYRRFIGAMRVRYDRLQPLQCRTHPGPRDVVRSGAWRDIPFLVRSLGSVLGAARLPAPVTQSLGIWTHVAGQSLATAPSPLALVPAVIHHVGAYHPVGGIGAIPDLLYAEAERHGVGFRFGAKVCQIHCPNGAARGVELTGNELVSADAVVSNVGLGTYLQLLGKDGLGLIPSRSREMLNRLPLQSPGVCAYLAVKTKKQAANAGAHRPPYLRFQVRNELDGCRLLVMPDALDPTVTQGGWSPARLIAPMHHTRAEAAAEIGQRRLLDRTLGEPWWREYFSEARVLATRIPSEWGSAFHLYADGMNPVMTARFMLAGRLAHRSPWIRRLYLTGSATHPGQWVSFCAVSGVLAADRVLEDVKE